PRAASSKTPTVAPPAPPTPAPTLATVAILAFCFSSSVIDDYPMRYGREPALLSACANLRNKIVQKPGHCRTRFAGCTSANAIAATSVASTLDSNASDEGRLVREYMRNLVGLPGFEPGTSCTPSKRASQAAPQPEFPIVLVLRTEPMVGF